MVRVRGALPIALSLVLGGTSLVFGGEDPILNGGGLLDDNAKKPAVASNGAMTGDFETDVREQLAELREEVDTLRREVDRLKAENANRNRTAERNNVVIVVVQNGGMAGRVGDVISDPRDPRNDPRYDPRFDPRLDPRDPRYDPRLDPRYDPRFDPRVSNPGYDPRWDPRNDPRYDPRFDPRYDPRYDPRTDPRFDPRFDPRTSDPRVDPRYDRRDQYAGMSWWQKLIMFAADGIIRGLERRMENRASSVRNSAASRADALAARYPDRAAEIRDRMNGMVDSTWRGTQPTANTRPVVFPNDPRVSGPIVRGPADRVPVRYMKAPALLPRDTVGRPILNITLGDPAFGCDDED